MAFKSVRLITAMTLVVVFFLCFAGTAGAEMIIISPTADSYTDSAHATSNYGRAKTLISRYDSDNNAKNMVFLRFDISSVPRGSSISEATLKIYLKEMTGQKTIKLGVYRATSDWSETSIHSQNKPTGPGPSTTNALVAAPGYKSFDLTEIFTGWLGNTFPNFGIFLGYQGTKGYVAEFNSRDALGSQPQLLVYFTPPSAGTDRISGMPMASGRAPLVSDVKVTKIRSRTATVAWKTDGMTTSKIRYGTTAAYDQASSNPDEATSHSMDIVELKPKTTYHFRIYGRNKAGLEAMSGDYQFTTSKEKTVKQIGDENRWAWLKLVAGGIGILLLLVGAVVFVFEFPRWRRGEFKIRDVIHSSWLKMRSLWPWARELWSKIRG